MLPISFLKKKKNVLRGAGTHLGLFSIILLIARNMFMVIYYPYLVLVVYMTCGIFGTGPKRTNLEMFLVSFSKSNT